MTFRPFSYENSIVTWLVSLVCVVVSAMSVFGLLPLGRTAELNTIFVFYWVIAIGYSFDIILPDVHYKAESADSVLLSWTNKVHCVNRVVFLAAAALTIAGHVNGSDYLGMYAIYLVSFLTVLTAFQAVLVR